MTDQPDSREVERVAVALANYECAKLDLTPLTGIDDFRHDYEREEYKSLARAAIAALATTGARVAELEAALRPFSLYRTTEETMTGDSEWANAEPMERIRLMGERKRERDGNILAARAALDHDPSAVSPALPIATV